VNKIKSIYYTSFFVFAAAVSLCGCATLSAIFTNPSSAPYITAAVDIAVATAEAKGVNATDINRIAKAALAADTGVTGTLSAISGLINGAIAKLKLPAGDQAAADILEIALSAAIQAKIGTNSTVAQAQAAISDVLNAVIAASGG